MKGTIRTFLALTLAAVMCVNTFASVGAMDFQDGGSTAGEGSTPKTANTVAGIVAGGGTVTGTAASKMDIGKSFSVTFDRAAFSWNGSGTPYDFSTFSNTWVKFSGSTGTTPVELVSVTPSTETGSVTVQLKANAVFSGTVNVWLNNGTASSATYSVKTEIEDPVAKAAEEKRLADEAEAKRIAAEAAEAKRIADEAAEAKRIADEAEAKRIADEAAEAKRIADEAEAKRIADEAEAKRIADEAEAKRIADEAEAKRIADEAEAKRIADEAEAKRIADEAEAKRIADEAAQRDQPATGTPTTPSGTPTTPVAPAAPAPNPSTIQQLRQGGGGAASSVGSSVNIGQTFNVIFQSDAFVWTNGDGTYDFSGFYDTWVKVTPDAGQVSYTTQKNTATGAVTVTVKADRAYNGPVTVQLNSGAIQSAKFQKDINLIDPANMPHTMDATVSGGLKPTSLDAGSSMVGGNEFTVNFDKSSFNWSAGGNSTFDFSKFSKTWVRVLPSPAPVEIVEVYPNTSTGGVAVKLRAKNAFKGTLEVYLQQGAAPSERFTKEMTITAQDAKILRTKTGGTAPSLLSGTVNILPGERLVYNILADNFEWSGDWNRLGTTLTDTSWVKLHGAATSDFRATYEPTGTADVRVILTAVRSGTYTNLQVYLSGGTGGASTTSSAATTVTVKTVDAGKIDGVSSGAMLGNGARLNGRSISYGELGSLEVYPDDEILIPLTAGLFTWTGSTPPYSETPVTKSQITAGRVRVETSGRSGSRIFKENPTIYYSGGNAYVRVQFAKDATGTKDQDFSMRIYLSVKGSRDRDSELELAGTLVRDIYELYDDDSYIDLSDGIVAEADSNIRNIEIYLGAEVTLFANLSSGRKYSGTATSEPSASDERLMAKYPEIESVYTLKTSGFTTGNSKVEIDVHGYYVYDKDLEYIGMTSERLPFSEKYYLAAKRVDFEEADDDDDYYDDDLDDDYDDDDDDNEPGGTSGTTPPAGSNGNGNPKTGR